MKKLICFLLIFVLMLTACSEWNVEIVDPTKPVESESELTKSEETGETHIGNISSEKAEIKELTEDGFANLRGSSLAFQLLENGKALFFAYKEGDPFEGGGVAVRVILYDYFENKTELIRELSFGDYKEVYVYERADKAKVVFVNAHSAEVLSIDTESLETETEKLEDFPGNISATGLWAICGNHLTIRDVEDNAVVSVIETGETKGFGSWSPDCGYFHIYQENGEAIYSISGEKTAEIAESGRRNWCSEENFFVYSEVMEDYSRKVWLLDASSGEKTEIEADSEALFWEKDFAVFKSGGKLCIKEYSTGNVFEIAENFGEYNYYEKAVYDKENETIIAAAYKEGLTEVWKIKLEWENGLGEKTEEQPEKIPEKSPDFAFEKPEILYPENVPEELYESAAFKEAMNRPSVILYDYEPISDCAAAVNFIEAVWEGKYSELYIFRFANIDFYNVKDASCTCLFTENGVITETAEDCKDREICSNYGYIKPIKNVYINDYGFFTVESEIYEPVYYKVISDFALYANEAEHRAMKEKYIDPIFTITVSPREFASVSDFSAAELVFLFEDIYNHENEHDPWQEFGNNWPLSEILSLLNRYFEGVTKEMIISDSRFAYNPETDSIFYEGGRGGVPPERRVFDSEQNGDILTIYYWLYHEESGTIYDDIYYALSVKLLPDGSFCYLSQEIIENKG